MKASILYRKQDGIGDLILVRTRKAGKDKAYDREAPGFSHMAWNATSREQVDNLHDILKENGAKILDPPCEMNYSPGYYAVWFEDPDGMKLELAYTPFQNPDLQSEIKRLRTKKR